MKLAEQTLEAFATGLASVSPTPGGGSASALAGALGASLCAMVARLTIGREKYKTAWEKMERLQARGDQLAGTLMTLVDRDTEAYNNLTASFRLPKGTDEEKAIRGRAVEDATLGAALAPLETLKTAALMPELVADALDLGNINCITDAGVAVHLIRAAAFGAAYNVRINISSLSDREKAAQLEQETVTLLDGIVKELAQIQDRMEKRLQNT